MNEPKIIDVNNTSFELGISSIDSEDNREIKVPYWAHSYVYSLDVLDQASAEQKEFYLYIKRNS